MINKEIKCLCVNCLKKCPFTYSKEDINESENLIKQKVLICWRCGFNSKEVLK